jgi:uncharacterized protein involved in exopolysaccharide biosynthesis
MEGQELVIQRFPSTLSWTLRDVVAMGFRRRRIALICFSGFLLGTIMFALLTPKYRAETEILVKRERVDPVVSAELTQPLTIQADVQEEEMNSEVEIIKSDDVLRKVVAQCDLDKPPKHAWFGSHTPQQRADMALDGLRSSLIVEALPKTHIIRIAYSSRSPELSAHVLEALDSAYLEVHQDMHRSAGQLAFFDQQADNASRQLQAAEEQLKEFPKQGGVANPTLARDYTLQKLNEFNYNLGLTRQSIAETQNRIEALQQLSKTTPPRLTTQMREADNGQAMQQLETTLLNLQLKRSDMVSKYQPDYPPVKELDLEIASTQASIAAQKPLADVTTDQNPAYLWIQSEQAKARADLRGSQAKATETESTIRQTMESARKLDADSIEQQDLLRTVKAAEENYLLYSHKREEARITEALDASKILNVVIAEKPSVPSFPAQSPWMLGLFGTMLAFAATAGIVFTMEYMDPSFRNPGEVQSVLNLPLLAAVPDQNLRGYRIATDNGNGNGNGNGSEGPRSGDSGPLMEGEVAPNSEPVS